MSADWPEVEFGSICAHSAFGPRFSGDEYSVQGNVAALRTTDISEDGRIEYRTMPTASLDTTRFEQHFLQRDDLVITRSGRVGTTAVFHEHSLPVLPGAFLIRFRLNRQIADPQFYRYFFNSGEGQSLIASVATGSVQQNVNIPSLHSLPVPLPTLPEQRAIAGVLGALDDKIELNRRMNATLEAMARALFQSWFVNFDPVRASVGQFQDSPIGKIPKGWKVERFDKHITADHGLSYKGEGLRDDGTGLPMHNLNSVYEGGGYRADRLQARA